MATLKSIRTRVISVKNTQKITKAMKMVSAAKLRRATDRLSKARPYAQKMQDLVSHIADLVSGEAHPLLKKRESVRRAEFLILTSDRGLCGGFNGNLLRMAERHLKAQRGVYEEVQFSVVGKKGRDFFVSRRLSPSQVQTGLYDQFDFAAAQKLAEGLMEGYQEGRFDEFYVVYNRFQSAISQIPTIVKILPFEPQQTAQAKSEAGTYTPEYIYEPNRQALLDILLPKALATVIYRVFLESITGEYGARMAAMDAATNNCSDMIRTLTLKMNRLRQAAITTELMDIVNGAEALG